MKKILTLGLALFIGVSLSSCDDDDNDVRPMGITPAGSFDNPNDDADDQDNFFNDNDGSTGFGDAPDGRRSFDTDLDIDKPFAADETTGLNNQTR